ncbi:hypothetical protein FHU41_000705 [Psychromicrobium silvestre]|uniref:Uncharacterized protein n=1 Tax=Psychromicrobium silvestre TaxID=1645614 RepID=A0A7Y9LRY3_9MICC|nr:hypothetical protein [Psychromicrobium silvestre]NYE94484.1 hypothetical protein [Psychromicrobium silvestre]
MRSNNFDNNLPLDVGVDAEVGCWGVWITGQGQANYDIGGSELGLDAGLVSDINDWADELTKAFNWDDPAATGPMRTGFLEDGVELGRRVRQQLPPAWTVWVRDPETYKRIELPSVS